MTSLDRVVLVLVLVFAAVAIIFAVAAVSDPAFATGGVGIATAILTAVGTALSAVAASSYFLRDVREAGKREKDEDANG